MLPRNQIKYAGQQNDDGTKQERVGTLAHTAAARCCIAGQLASRWRGPLLLPCLLPLLPRSRNPRDVLAARPWHAAFQRRPRVVALRRLVEVARVGALVLLPLRLGRLRVFVSLLGR